MLIAKKKIFKGKKKKDPRGRNKIVKILNFVVLVFYKH